MLSPRSGECFARLVAREASGSTFTGAQCFRREAANALPSLVAIEASDGTFTDASCHRMRKP
jgi:hypothetical protein